MAGPPIQQIAIAEPLAEPGETVISKDAWMLVKDVVVGTDVRDLVHVCASKVRALALSLVFVAVFASRS